MTMDNVEVVKNIYVVLDDCGCSCLFTNGNADKSSCKYFKCLLFN